MTDAITPAPTYVRAAALSKLKDVVRSLEMAKADFQECGMIVHVSMCDEAILLVSQPLKEKTEPQQ